MIRMYMSHGKSTTAIGNKKKQGDKCVQSGVASRSPLASDFCLVASGDAVFAGGEQIQVTRQRRATGHTLLFTAGSLLFIVSLNQ